MSVYHLQSLINCRGSIIFVVVVVFADVVVVVNAIWFNIAYDPNLWHTSLCKQCFKIKLLQLTIPILHCMTIK